MEALNAVGMNKETSMQTSQGLRLSVQNMSCASCVGRVQRALSALPGVTEVNVNLATETAQAQVDSRSRIGDVVEALSQAGYPARTQSVRLNISSMSSSSSATCSSIIN